MFNLKYQYNLQVDKLKFNFMFNIEFNVKFIEILYLFYSYYI